MDRSFSFADFMNFEKLIAPKVLKVVYWLGLAGIVVMVLIGMAGGLAAMQYSFATGLGTILMSLIGGLFGLLMWRVLIEMYTVFFGIYERLGDIRESVKKN